MTIEQMLELHAACAANLRERIAYARDPATKDQRMPLEDQLRHGAADMNAREVVTATYMDLLELAKMAKTITEQYVRSDDPVLSTLVGKMRAKIERIEHAGEES